MEIVERFATALDVDDYKTADLCLEKDAVYDSGDKVFRGTSDIVESFRKASEWGRSKFQSLQFLHEIDDEQPLAVRFIDIITVDDEEFVLDHTMHVTLSESGLIASLRLEYPAGERERADAFFKRHGLGN